MPTYGVHYYEVKVGTPLWLMQNDNLPHLKVTHPSYRINKASLGGLESAIRASASTTCRIS